MIMSTLFFITIYLTDYLYCLRTTISCHAKISQPPCRQQGVGDQGKVSGDLPTSLCFPGNRRSCNKIFQPLFICNQGKI